MAASKPQLPNNLNLLGRDELIRLLKESNRKWKAYWKDHYQYQPIARNTKSQKKRPKYLSHLPSEGYKRLIKECAICGFDLLVDIHHINGNLKQNNIGNLIGLCPNHHMLVHRRGLTIKEMRSKRIGCSQSTKSKFFPKSHA